jgi:hypothetical protein
VFKVVFFKHLLFTPSRRLSFLLKVLLGIVVLFWDGVLGKVNRVTFFII